MAMAEAAHHQLNVVCVAPEGFCSFRNALGGVKPSQRRSLWPQILGNGPDSLPKRSVDYETVDMLVGPGKAVKRGKLQSMMVTGNEDAWRNVRRTIQPAFSPHCIRCVRATPAARRAPPARHSTAMLCKLKEGFHLHGCDRACMHRLT